MPAPCSRITILLVVLLVTAMIASNVEACVRFNCICLLLYQVLRRCDENNLSQDQKGALETYTIVSVLPSSII